MRAYEFLDEETNPFRGVTLRTINQWKHAERRRQQAEAERAELLPFMYGQGDQHEEFLKTIERERATVELAKKKVELEALQAKKVCDTQEAIHRLSRSEMARRKKA